jgi:photosystem I subunit 10
LENQATARSVPVVVFFETSRSRGTDKIVRFLPPLQIVCANTAAIMGAMRFGLMPSVKKNYNGASSYGMVDQASTKNIGSRDPAGFTAVDVLAAGSFATIISAGEILANQVPY